MRGRIGVLRLAFSVALFCCGQQALAGSYEIVPVDVSSILPGHTTHRVLINTDPGQFVGASHIDLQLTSGKIRYPGGELVVPLNPVWIGPSNPIDDYTTYLSAGSSGDQPAVFADEVSATALKASWGPALGQSTDNVMDFLTAQITMTSTAAGFIRYRSEFLGGWNTAVAFDLPIARGIIGLPEPASWLTAAVAMTIGVTRRRRATSRGPC